MKRAFLFSYLVAAPLLAQQPEIVTKIVDLYQGRNCVQCHEGKTARESMAHWTTAGGERELLKSLAYHHYQLRDRVLKELGPKTLKAFPFIERPQIDPANRISIELVYGAIRRDGDDVSPEEQKTVEEWFKQGAPLPADILDETLEEVRWDARILTQ